MDKIDSGYKKCGTANIYYEIYGDGEPLIFLHGNSESMKYFRNNVGFFAEKYKVVLIDTRSHGRSSHGGEALDFTTIACDVFEVLEALAITKASIIGFSDGGNTALYMALIESEKIDKIVLCGANLNFSGMVYKAQLIIYLMLISAYIKHTIFKHRKSEIDIINLMVKYPDLKLEHIANIYIKTLVLVGEYDVIKLSHSKSIANTLKNSELKIIKGGDHFIMRDKSGECNNAILSFLEDSY